MISKLLTFTVFILSSCATTYHWKIGDTKEEFFAANEKNIQKLSVELDTGDRTVYKTPKSRTHQLCFFFKNGVLDQVNKSLKPTADMIFYNK